MTRTDPQRSCNCGCSPEPTHGPTDHGHGPRNPLLGRCTQYSGHWTLDSGRSLAGVKISPTRGIVARYSSPVCPEELKMNSNPYDTSKRKPASERGRYRVTQRLTAHLRRTIDNLSVLTNGNTVCMCISLPVRTSRNQQSAGRAVISSPGPWISLLYGSLSSQPSLLHCRGALRSFRPTEPHSILLLLSTLEVCVHCPRSIPTPYTTGHASQGTAWIPSLNRSWLVAPRCAPRSQAPMAQRPCWGDPPNTSMH